MPRSSTPMESQIIRRADHDFSTGAPVSANYYEITAGVAIKPFPNDQFLSKLLLRPEVRYDDCNKPAFCKRDQLTFSVDTLFTF